MFKKLRIRYLIAIASLVIIIAGIIAGWQYYRSIYIEIQKPREVSKRYIKPVKMVIEARLVNIDIYVTQILYYSSSDFSIILNNWSIYKKMYLSNISRFYESGINITCRRVEYDIDRHTIIVSWVVKGAVWISNNRFGATFLWLLTPLNLDFIEDHFKESNDGLYWSGVINGVPTEIIIKLPPQREPYKAWGGDVGHCHGHVWGYVS